VYDGHGSVRALTNTTGAVTDTYDYDAFGNLIHQTGSTPNNYLFAGEQFDPDLHLYYNRARYLNVSTGRFWNMDSFDGYLSDPLSLHKYLYCFGSAPNCLDPSGQDGDYGSTMAAVADGIIVDSTPVLNFLRVVAVVGAVAVGYVAAPLIDDAFERNKSRFAAFGATVTTAVALFQYHFQRWRQDSDFQRPGNHNVEVEFPSGPTWTPRVLVNTITAQIPLTSFRVILEFYEGGDGGRIFGVQYRIGANAKLGRGYFGFRADYLDFRSKPPVFGPHLHWTYSFGGEDQNEDHVPL
jgi:RHS repeat-associated protein